MKYEINFQQDGQQYPSRVAEFPSKKEAQAALLLMVNFHFDSNFKMIAQAVAATRNNSYNKGFVKKDSFYFDNKKYYISEVDE